MLILKKKSSKDLVKACVVTVQESLKIQKGERVCIITNPVDYVSEISWELYRQVKEVGGIPNIIYQEVKTQLDSMDDTVWGALSTEPEVYISMSANKLGKDLRGSLKPYIGLDGKSYDSLSSYLIDGKKVTRGFWSPGITKELFQQSVPVNFGIMKAQCKALGDKLTQAVAVRIQAPGGTNVSFGLSGRTAFVDDGDFSLPGSGGNLPAGEAFISPVNGTAEGTIVFDGSMSVKNGTILCRKPIQVKMEKGFVKTIEGGTEAQILEETILLGEQNALVMEAEGRLTKGLGNLYKQNARALGELGIGVNPLAKIVGNMIVDEKVAKTCHFAIGRNYDMDGPALIHLDGLVKYPTITLTMPDNKEVLLIQKGELQC